MRSLGTGLLVLLVAAAAAAERPLLVTVDDLPVASGSLHAAAGDRERVTRGLLAALEAHAVRAVGLVTWDNVRSESDRGLLDLWTEAGHELGNHTIGHPDLTRMTAEEFLADAEAARARLAAYLEAHDGNLRFFRFPMLHEGETHLKLGAVRSWLRETGQRSLPVTIDTQDCSFERPWVEALRVGDERARARIAESYHEALHVSVRHHEALGDELLGRTSPQIILLHANAIGAAEWDELFTWLEDTGHRFVSADDLLTDPVLDDEPEVVTRRGYGLWERLRIVQWLASARAEVEALLAEQVRAWNRGDLEAFTAVYAEDAVFVTPSGLTRGRDEVLRRYRGRYVDREGMGKLTLEILDLRPVRGEEVSMLGDSVPGQVHAVSVVARWRLAGMRGEVAEASGLTVLALRRDGSAWTIVHDASM